MTERAGLSTQDLTPVGVCAERAAWAPVTRCQGCKRGQKGKGGSTVASPQGFSRVLTVDVSARPVDRDRQAATVHGGD